MNKQHIHILRLRQKLLVQHKHVLAAADKLQQLNPTASYEPCVPGTRQGKLVRG